MATYKETVGTSVVNYAGNYPGAVNGEPLNIFTNRRAYEDLLRRGAFR